MSKKQKHTKRFVYKEHTHRGQEFSAEITETNDSDLVTPKRPMPKASKAISKESTAAASQSNSRDTTKSIEEKFARYVNDIAQHIDQRHQMVSAEVYAQQKESWARKNDKLQEKLRHVKAAREETNDKLAKALSIQKHFEECVEHLKDQKATLKAKMDEYEGLLAEKEDEMQLVESRLKDVQNEYNAMRLTKDKMIESLQFAANRKAEEVESMKTKFVYCHRQLDELEGKYNTTIYEFTESNDSLMKRNDKLKAKCKEFLQQQQLDIEDRGKLLKRIQLLQKQKTMIKKHFVATFKREVMAEFIDVDLDGDRDEDDMKQRDAASADGSWAETDRTETVESEEKEIRNPSKRHASRNARITRTAL